MTRESIVSTATSDSFIRDLSQKTIKSLPMTTTSSSSTITTHSSTSTVTDKLLENMSRECLLFPTYAKRDPSDPSKWIVQTKGWALSHNSSTTKQKMMMGITKSVAGKSGADQESSQMFEQRFKYFLATNKRHKRFCIQAKGMTTLEELQRNQNQLLKQVMINNQTLFSFDSLSMLSTRLNQMITTNKLKQYCFLNTPPMTDEEEDEEEEGWMASRPLNPISSVTNGYPTRKTSGLDDESGVHLKTKGSGFLSGQFELPHDTVLNWAQEQKQCDTRLIQIQSVCTENNNKFSPNYGVVNLIEPTGISIISDIDDTIKDTRILSGARTVLSKTFFEQPQGVSGMADVYMAWYSQGASFHYVSNSPFQLMPMLDQFLLESHFPPGSMHLRDDGKMLARLVETPGQAKRDAILKILADFPKRRFILIGDSGEIDLEIYTRIALENPDQIFKIYIRDVTTPNTIKQQEKRGSSTSTLSSLFYSKRRYQFSDSRQNSVSSTSSSEDTLIGSPSPSSTADDKKNNSIKKKFKSPLGMRKAVTTTLAEFAVEPHLTGHSRNKTIHISSTLEDQGILDPHRLQKKISTAEACVQLDQRLEKARLQLPGIQVKLFKDAQTLQNDHDISNALWDEWDDISNRSPNSDNEDILCQSPTSY